MAFDQRKVSGTGPEVVERDRQRQHADTFRADAMIGRQLLSVKGADCDHQVGIGGELGNLGLALRQFVAAHLHTP